MFKIYEQGVSMFQISVMEHQSEDELFNINCDPMTLLFSYLINPKSSGV